MRRALFLPLFVCSLSRADVSIPASASPLHFDFSGVAPGGVAGAPLVGWAPNPSRHEPPLMPLVGMAWPVYMGGSCDGARPNADVSRYRTPLRVNGKGARVRSRALFDAETDNVIGAVQGGSDLMAEGPLKDAEFPDGIGWAIMVSDGARSCRGYVSDSVVHHR
jgi:hypothetical protein